MLPDALDLPGGRLRALTTADWELDRALSQVPDVPRWTYYPADLDEAEARRRIARSIELRADGRGGRFVVERDGVPVGTIGIAQRVDGPSVYYAFLPSGRGRGLATAAVDGLCRWVLEHGAVEVSALTMLENTASERVLERASFVRGELEVEHDGVTVTRWRRTIAAGASRTSARAWPTQQSVGDG